MKRKYIVWIAGGGIGLALMILLVVFRGTTPSEVEADLVADSSPSTEANGASPISEPTGAEAKGGLTFANSGQDEDDAEEIGCSVNEICLLGRYSPGLAVRILLPSGDSCTGRTGDAYHFAGEASDRDMTAVVELDACLASDLGPDGSVAIVETQALLDAELKWLPVVVAETPLTAPPIDPTVRSVVGRYTQATGLTSPPLYFSVQIGQHKFLSVQPRPEEKQGSSGPVFYPVQGRFIHPSGENLCQTLTGAFSLDSTTYVIQDFGVCGGDPEGREILEWTGKEWKSAASLPW
ncbi:MAG: hypothetical protein NDI61_07605 [Bdellovibrionaceae bacterium]|nr:hypothetical protein [Pseudobdellovibrionaceae bacterium]